MLFAPLGMLTLSMASSNAQAQHRHYHNHYGHNHSAHHHHDAAGHRVDDAGHHIDLYGRHTGAVGVYDNGAVSVPRSVYSPSVGVGIYYGGAQGYSNYGYYAPNQGVANYTVVAPQQQIVPQQSYVPQQTNVINRAPQNVIPGAGAFGNGGIQQGKITILNPAGSGGSVNYNLNGSDYTIREGSVQSFDNDRTWVVSFGSGGPKGDIRYTLSPGLFKFKVIGAGWELVRAAEQPESLSNIPPSPVLAPVPNPPVPNP